ncbi:hypothetical protein SAMN05444128_3361 [Pontibacter indicus]|uniref:Uncharacterized protein n=1 Tax=Pontibacter indicus TaxID=1317125 RepID=A0A1R3XQS0_9BACT|nr:hypothetical protein SAMN05444128_3361 [Pontibacter indicus]
MKKGKLQLKKQVVLTLTTQAVKGNRMENVFTTAICTVLTTATETSL